MYRRGWRWEMEECDRQQGISVVMCPMCALCVEGILSNGNGRTEDGESIRPFCWNWTKLHVCRVFWYGVVCVVCHLAVDLFSFLVLSEIGEGRVKKSCCRCCCCCCCCYYCMNWWCRSASFRYTYLVRILVHVLETGKDRHRHRYRHRRNPHFLKGRISNFPSLSRLPFA
ncbi:hypothetical protein F4820DRAFT_50338 [Hypoxylon rubiginosum]|uniref:Uncharacterized protein n=1 Tax=Hypoxylon rubiginosum TaxID=110542 RepID=A0ACB9YRW5_9PEZI|nr:hypothetical protein F4820DRAFT_50338 [Hypoxylon rubiginosum]